MVIEGRLIELSFNPNQKESTLVFSTVKTLRGIKKIQWTVTMRETRVPTTPKDYVKRFGNFNEVGIKIAPKVANGAYVVDNACKMNGDDWFIRSVNSYQVVEISVDLLSSTAAKQYLRSRQPRVCDKTLP